MPSYIDIHNHILYGLDDGARSLKESKRMADAAEREGIRRIIATPHVKPGMRSFNAKHYALALSQLNLYCREKGYRLRIAGGAEIRWTHATVRLLRKGRVPTMNNTRFVLIEFSDDETLDEIWHAVRELSNAGYYVICAHVERCHALYSKNAIEQLRDRFGMYVQVDCEVLTRRCSLRVKRFVKRLLKRKLVDYMASDAHDRYKRSINMDEAHFLLEQTYGVRYARKLTEKNQRELFKT